jgi:hypothetical protein
LPRLAWTALLQISASRVAAITGRVYYHFLFF